MTVSDVSEAVQALSAPSTFSSRPLKEEEIRSWQAHALDTLKSLKHPWPPQTPEETAQLLAQVATFQGDDPWLNENLRRTAADVLSLNANNVNQNTLTLVLERHVKPAFLCSPHPQLNLVTGRKLPREAGGPMAAQDYYQDQLWKNRSGLGNLLAWCVGALKADYYESLWHLVIPPIVTFLDDYQAAYKLRGAIITSLMLDNVPPILLKRTGVGELLSQSLSMTFSHLQDEKSPELIRQAARTVLKLIDKTTSADTSERFDKLCHLLGENIVGGVWVYASRDLSIIETSMDTLPPIVRMLGIGSARYLKALVPQCLHCIFPNEWAPERLMLQQAAMRALVSIIEECAPRIHRWKGAIIEGVGKAWVVFCDIHTKRSDDDRISFEQHVRGVFIALGRSCPSVLRDEYERLQQTDISSFGPIMPLHVDS